MTLITLLQSILLIFLTNIIFLLIFHIHLSESLTTDQHRDTHLETREQHIMIMNPQLSQN